MDYSYQNKINDNSFKGDTWIGITLMRECSTNTISNNIININSTKNILQHPSTGIWLRTYCYQNTITNNQISNCHIGLWIGRSHSNIIEGNHIKNCHIIPSQDTKNSIINKIFKNIKSNIKSIETRGAGIYLIETGNNEIIYNTLHQNDIGIINYRSWMDNIQFNNIMDSTTGFDFIALLSLGYYPLNYWGSSITGPLMKSNRLFMLFPWSPIRISEAP
jgi:parallel beta-helix repeat protein